MTIYFDATLTDLRSRGILFCRYAHWIYIHENLILGVDTLSNPMMTYGTMTEKKKHVTLSILKLRAPSLPCRFLH